MLPIKTRSIFVFSLFVCLLLPPQIKGVKELTEFLQRVKRYIGSKDITKSDAEGRWVYERPQSDAGRPGNPIHGRDGDWSYWGKSGPERWVELYPACGGALQSPVAITSSSEGSPLGPFRFQNYHKPIADLELTNDGHTVELSAPPNAQIGLDAGGLKAYFQFSRIHFHWGSTSAKGSDHTIDGQRYPLEMHLLHLNEQNTAAVFVVMFKETRRNNENLTPIIKALRKVTHKGEETVVRGPIKLFSLLPGEDEHYYRYEGSFTAPPCTEGVTWTIFHQPLFIGTEQLEEFRKLKRTRKDDPHPKFLVDNFRPLQNLNNRKVQEMKPRC